MKKKNIIIIICAVIVLSVGIIVGLQLFHPKSAAVKSGSGPEEKKETIETAKTDEDPKIEMDAKLVHPVVNSMHRVIGGVVEDKWLNQEDIWKYMKQGEKFSFRSFDLNGFVGEYEGYLPENPPDKYFVAFDEKDSKFYSSTISVCGDWNIEPRVPKIIDENLPQTDAFIGELLKAKGCPQSPVKIKKIIQIDIDGDGSDEAFIIASNISKKDIDIFCEGQEDVRKGKYSLILVRGALNGVENSRIILAEYNQMFDHEIEFIGDINNDGQMELLINEESIEAVTAEGFSVGTEFLYRIRNGEVEEITSIFNMPH